MEVFATAGGSPITVTDRRGWQGGETLPNVLMAAVVLIPRPPQSRGSRHNVDWQVAEHPAGMSA
jgi:hypothetical protein